MTAPNTSTFDLALPRRPGTDDFNGINKQDDAAYPPDPQIHPNAAEWNTIEWIMLSLGRVIPVAVITVDGGATPTITAFGCVRKTVTTGSFTVVRNSAGNVSITWAANTFPPAAAKPMACLNEGPGEIAVNNIANGIQVFTYNSAGTATDKDFTASVF